MKIKRIYEPTKEIDGYRILIDRLWPRGISKSEAKIDEWLKILSPSADLRKWFNHEPEKFQEFRKRYIEELNQQTTELKRIKSINKSKEVTLLYAAKDTEHNNAVVVLELLNKMK